MGWPILQSLSKRYFQASWGLPLAAVARKFGSEYKSSEDITDCNQKSPPWNVMFFGTDDFSLKSLEMLHMEQQRGGLIKRLDVVSVALKKSLTAVQHYCQKEGLQVTDWPVTVPQRKYDVGIVASFGHLIPASVISAFPMGIVNVHGSLLPRWRGAAPVIHALLNQDQQTGITLMRIAPFRFDVGHVISKVVVPVEWNIKSRELTAQLAEMGAQELLSILPNLPQHLREACPQSSEGVTKAPKVNESASRVWWEKWSCSDVQAHYRALDDYIPLWSLWQETPIKLRGMVMQKKWSSNKRDVEMLKEFLQINRGGSVRENTESEFIDNVHNCYRSDSAAKNNFVVKNSTKAHLCDNIDTHSQKIVEREVPGSVVYNRKAKEIRVYCRDGWVAFQHVVLKGRKLMTAQDFYNGFMSKVSKDLHRFT